jgi:hypothetical protein
MGIFENLYKPKSPELPVTPPTQAQVSKAWLKETLRQAYHTIIGREANIRPTEYTDITSFSGTRKSSPSHDKLNRQYHEPALRRALIYQIQELVADHPILDAAIDKYCNGAVGAGFTAVVTKGPDLDTINRAQYIIDRLKRRTFLEALLPRVARTALTFGDSFVQPVLRSGESQISSLIEMPVDTMERLTDDCDQFIEEHRAFMQRDANSNELLSYFNAGQIIHIRNKFIPGQRYGKSSLFAARGAAKDTIDALRSLLPRRLANQPFRVFNLQGFDGQPLSDRQFQEFKEKMDRKVAVEQGIYDPAFADVFVNRVDVQVMGGDANVSSLDDILMLVDSSLSPMGVSRQLLGWGTTVNRDVLDEQREELYESESQFAVQVILNQFLMPLYDMALILAGIDPDKIEISVEFAQSLTETQRQKKLENARLDYTTGGISQETYVRIVGPYYGVKDFERELKTIQEKTTEVQNKAEFVQQDIPGTSPSPTNVKAQTASAQKSIPETTVFDRLKANPEKFFIGKSRV